MATPCLRGHGSALVNAVCPRRSRTSRGQAVIDERCIGPGVDRSKISPQAEVTRASYLTGPRTAVGPGAVVRDARLHDAIVEEGATIVDSICLAEGTPRSYQCDAAGRTIVSGAAHKNYPGCINRVNRVAQRFIIRTRNK